MTRIEVSTREFMFAHGRTPGGEGNWAFFFDADRAIESAFWFRGPFKSARRAAVAEARRRGAHTVHVGT